MVETAGDSGLVQRTLKQANGGIYVGTVDQRTGLPEGEGKLTYPDSQEYAGAFHKGKFHGFGVYTYSDGVYEGQWVDGRRHGQGTFRYRAHPKLLSVTADYRHNTVRGTGTVEYVTGAVYQGGLFAAMPTGKGKLREPNGNEYVGDFRKGKFEGKGTYTNLDRGELQVGTFKRSSMASGEVTPLDPAQLALLRHTQQRFRELRSAAAPMSPVEALELARRQVEQQQQRRDEESERQLAVTSASGSGSAVELEPPAIPECRNLDNTAGAAVAAPPPPTEPTTTMTFPPTPLPHALHPGAPFAVSPYFRFVRSSSSSGGVCQSEPNRPRRCWDSTPSLTSRGTQTLPAVRGTCVGSKTVAVTPLWGSEHFTFGVQCKLLPPGGALPSGRAVLEEGSTQQPTLAIGNIPTFELVDAPALPSLSSGPGLGSRCEDELCEVGSSEGGLEPRRVMRRTIASSRWLAFPLPAAGGESSQSVGLELIPVGNNSSPAAAAAPSPATLTRQQQQRRRHPNILQTSTSPPSPLPIPVPQTSPHTPPPTTTTTTTTTRRRRQAGSGSCVGKKRPRAPKATPEEETSRKPGVRVSLWMGDEWCTAQIVSEVPPVTLRPTSSPTGPTGRRRGVRRFVVRWDRTDWPQQEAVDLGSSDEGVDVAHNEESWYYVDEAKFSPQQADTEQTT